MKTIVDVKNSLTQEQRDELSDKIEKLMAKYSGMALRGNRYYFSGVVDGMSSIYKLINEIDDDYNSAD